MNWIQFKDPLCYLCPRGDAPGAHPSLPTDPNFLNFMRFLEKFVCWCLPMGVGTPSYGESWIRAWLVSWSLTQEVAGSNNLFKIQVCIPVGCVPPTCCPYLPACTMVGVCSWGCLLPGGVYFQEVSADGGCLPLVPGGVYPSMQWDRQTPVKK